MPLVLFLLCLVATLIDTFLHGPPWVPALLVATYGLTVWYLSRWRASHQRDVLLDSPYYLGFLQTQIALIALFWDTNITNGQAIIDRVHLTHGIAIALSTSVLGLTLRHIVVSTHRMTRNQFAAIEQLQNDLAKYVDVYATAQKSFAELVSNFGTDRKQMLQDEQDISRKYVRTLRDATRVLSTLVEKASPFSEQTMTVAASLSSLISSLESARAALADLSTSSQRADLVVGRLRTAVDSAGKRTTTFGEEVEAADKVLEGFIRFGQSRLEQLGAVYEGLHAERAPRSRFRK